MEFSRTGEMSDTATCELTGDPGNARSQDPKSEVICMICMI